MLYLVTEARQTCMIGTNGTWLQEVGPPDDAAAAYAHAHASAKS